MTEQLPPEDTGEETPRDPASGQGEPTATTPLSGEQPAGRPTAPRPGPTAYPPPAPAYPAPYPPPSAAAFPPVLRTPWVNPARRTHVIVTSVVALVVVAVAAFLGGLAAGSSGGHRREVRVVCGPIGLRDVPNGLGRGGAMGCAGVVCRPIRRCMLPLRPLQQHPDRSTAPASPSTPTPSGSTSS